MAGMDGNFIGMLVAAGAFGITFALVRIVTTRRRRQRAEQARAQALQGASRQVRRAHARRASGRAGGR
jgi:type II secretory pathway pseudopilin PulG